MQILAQPHGAEVRAAHRAIFAVCHGAVLVVLQGAFRIERQVELVFPTEFEAGFAQGIVTDLCARMPFCQVSGMRGNLIGHDSGSDIFFVGESEMFLRSDVTDHRRAVPGNLGGSDSRCDMVVAWSNIRCQRA